MSYQEYKKIIISITEPLIIKESNKKSYQIITDKNQKVRKINVKENVYRVFYGNSRDLVAGEEEEETKFLFILNIIIS